jgi:hypothetical protein
MYGAGMVSGALLLRFVRHRLCRLPVVGLLARPILGESLTRAGRSTYIVLPASPKSSVIAFPVGSFWGDC